MRKTLKFIVLTTLISIILGVLPFFTACGASINNEKNVKYSQNLAFELNAKQTGYILTGIGDCVDKKIVIPNEHNDKPVLEIVMEAFAENILIESIIIPDSVTNIGSGAFSYCSSLTSIVIPDSVTRIGSFAFYDCNALTIYCEATKKSSWWDSNWNYSKCPIVWNCNNNDMANDGYVYTIIDGLRYGIKEGGARVARQPTNVTITNIPSSIIYKESSYSVIGISESAFSYCTSLTSIVIPDSVINIGSFAFSNCSSLINAIFENTTGWYYFSFNWITTVGKVSIPDLSNPSTAATYLVSTYVSENWENDQ